MLHLSGLLLWLQPQLVAGVLCAEASFDRADTWNVAQVIRNRTRAGSRYKGASFSKTVLGVITRRRAFANPNRCAKLRKHHFDTALRLLAGRRLNAHRRVKPMKVVFFLNLKRYGQLYHRWRKTRLVAHKHKRTSKRGKPYGHVYMFLREAYR